MSYDVERIREQIPALASGVAFFDGPGGTQTARAVSAAIASVLNAPLSNRGTVTEAERNAEQIVQDARTAGADFLGSDSRGIVFGRSATEITFMMARTISTSWGPGDEVIVTSLDHDSNVRPWVRYAEKVGATVRWAHFDPTTAELPVSVFEDLLSPRTRLVALTGASNVLGTRPDVHAIATAAHAVGARVYLDGVHLAAHALIDRESLGVDAVVCSPYKFLGPHIGMLAADPEWLETLHPDKLRPSTEVVPERFELGTLPYEMLAGVRAAIDVLADLDPTASGTRRERLMASYSALEVHEHDVHAHLRSGLSGLPGVALYSNAHHRTPTEFFSFAGVESAAVYRALAERGVNVPASNFYAIEACDRLGLGAAGAVRAGLAPYTTRADVDRLLQGLADIVGA